MPQIISVSRRTDIPAFYGNWFLNRLTDGFAGYVNPFGQQKYLVSLKPEDVVCFVFWSKNFIPFFEPLKKIRKLGYSFYFNYTINGYPSYLEPSVAKQDQLIDNLKALSDLYSPLSIHWRYDPIIITDETDLDYHRHHFQYLASQLQNYVKRCYFSFVTLYGKVQKNLIKLQKEHRINSQELLKENKIAFAAELAEIALHYGITMYSCCGNYLINSQIKKGHCVDGDLINELFYKGKPACYFPINPTRKECGCTRSVDIGVYNSCTHGCIYCYANLNKESALNRCQTHDPDSVFLGYTRNESELWLKEGLFINSGKL